jgi:hypothetical protein
MDSNSLGLPIDNFGFCTYNLLDMGMILANMGNFDITLERAWNDLKDIRELKQMGGYKGLC